MVLTASIIDQANKALGENYRILAEDLIETLGPENQDAYQKLMGQFDFAGNDLTRPDFFVALAENQDRTDAEGQDLVRALRKALWLPEKDVSVSLRFSYEVLSNGGIVACTHFIPTAFNASALPVIHDPGAFLPTAAYASFLAEWVYQEGMTLTSYDLPGVGGSGVPKGESIGPEIFYEAARLVRRESLQAGEKFVSVSHSAGVMGANQYRKESSLPENQDWPQVKKPIYIEWMPADAERRAGRSFQQPFVTVIAAPLLLGDLIPVFSDWILGDERSEGELNWLRSMVDTQVIPISILGTLKAFSEISQNSYLAQEGGDPYGCYIVGDQSKLIPNQWPSRSNVKQWQNEGHSPHIGTEGSREKVGKFKKLIASCSNADPVDLGEESKGLVVNLSPGISARSIMNPDGQVALQGSVSTKLSLEYNFIPELSMALSGELLFRAGNQTELITNGSFELNYLPSTNGFLKFGVGLAGGANLIDANPSPPLAYAKTSIDFQGAPIISILGGISSPNWSLNGPYHAEVHASLELPFELFRL